MRSDSVSLSVHLLIICGALISVTLFGIIAAASPQALAFFAEHKKLFVMLHVASMALGVGGATFSDIFFFKFLKDFKISRFEKSVLDTLSNIIWVMLFIAMVTGIILFLPESERLLKSSKFLLKVVVVSVVTLNGVALNVLIAPSLMKFSFNPKSKPSHKTMHYTRKLGFALGAISILSWWSSFVLGSVKSLPWSFGQLLVGYIFLLFCGIIGSQLMDWWYCHRAQKSC